MKKLYKLIKIAIGKILMAVVLALKHKITSNKNIKLLLMHKCAAKW